MQLLLCVSRLARPPLVVPAEPLWLLRVEQRRGRLPLLVALCSGLLSGRVAAEHAWLAAHVLQLGVQGKQGCNSPWAADAEGMAEEVGAAVGEVAAATVVPGECGALLKKARPFAKLTAMPFARLGRFAQVVAAAGVGAGRNG